MATTTPTGDNYIHVLQYFPPKYLALGSPCNSSQMSFLIGIVRSKIEKLHHLWYMIYFMNF